MKLMMQDEVVLSYNIQNCTKHVQANFEIINSKLMPIELYSLLDITKEEANFAIQKITTFIANRDHILSKQNQAIINDKWSFLSSKQGGNAAIFRATSMADSYWIKPDNSNLTWEQVNPRTNRLCDICTLKENGKPILKPQTEIQISANIQNGASPKIWKESLTNASVEKELYKQNDEKSTINEAELECIVSDILDHTNISHVRYQMVDERICKCKNMADEEKSIISAATFRSFCNRTEEDMEEIIKETDYTNYCKMKVFDYLIDNRDRTDNNYGFYRDNQTGNIIGLHPLFDHNNAFGNSHKSQEYIPKSQLSDWLKHSNLKFNSNLSIKDFHYDKEKYTQFMERACEIGICEKAKEKQTFIQKISKKEPETIYQIKKEYLSEELIYDKPIPYQIFEEESELDLCIEKAQKEIENRTQNRENIKEIDIELER